MTDLTRLSAAELAEGLEARDFSSVEATQAHLDRIGVVEGAVNAFLHVNTDEALATARSVDDRRVAGEPVHRLAGVPIAVKDVVVTKGMPTTAGSKILEGWVPPYDATLVEKIRAAGLPILGKTNMDEFAMGSSTEHSAYGNTRNPWDLDRIPGGSGGGSAAAVAAFEAPLATSTAATTTGRRRRRRRSETGPATADITSAVIMRNKDTSET
ncbi:amidase family protein, partial [Cellulosimicrobium cellulans]|uniref:amidase n=1 Tax=Cellulosimicrobium cellulans TaxID=1710 RepID=UPI00214A05DF|nr:amidase family protein [Cellulosimicrobium cellulans]